MTLNEKVCAPVINLLLFVFSVNLTLLLMSASSIIAVRRMDPIQMLFAHNPSLPATHAAHPGWTGPFPPRSPCHRSPRHRRASAPPAPHTAHHFTSAPWTKCGTGANGSLTCRPTTTARPCLSPFPRH